MANPIYNPQVTCSRSPVKRVKKMAGGMMRKNYATGTQEKNFSKLPEAVQKKIDSKLAEKV